jgi:DNA-binding NtrC family response regulator
MTWKVVLGSADGPGSRMTSPQTQPKATPPTGDRLRVLVVDDEPSICKALCIALSEEGYEAIAAHTGESALAIIRNEHLDIMIVDLRINDMRGDVIFEVAAGHQPHLRYQTLFITGDITDRAAKLIEACHCNMLPKPFDLHDVFAAIAELTPRSKDQTA